MSKAVGGSVWSELKGTDSEKPLLPKDEDRIPDFFDHWMEEYISKSRQISQEPDSRRPSTETRPKSMKKRRAKN